MTVAGFGLTGVQGDMARPGVLAVFGVIAGSMYVVGLWLEHRAYRFAVDLGRAVLLLSAGQWMPWLAGNTEGVTSVMQSLGAVNVLLLAGLYALQREQGSMTALP